MRVRRSRCDQNPDIRAGAIGGNTSLLSIKARSPGERVSVPTNLLGRDDASRRSHRFGKCADLPKRRPWVVGGLYVLGTSERNAYRIASIRGSSCREIKHRAPSRRAIRRMFVSDLAKEIHARSRRHLWVKTGPRGPGVRDGCCHQQIRLLCYEREAGHFRRMSLGGYLRLSNCLWSAICRRCTTSSSIGTHGT